jgi:hypothetical protein
MFVYVAEDSVAVFSEQHRKDNTREKLEKKSTAQRRSSSKERSPSKKKKKRAT